MDWISAEVPLCRGASGQARTTSLDLGPIFASTFDAAPLSQAVDCGLGVLAFAEIALALTSALPAY
ncbi:MAG: hypothetical protein EA397_18050 [Deltaproteobacteria bacterium]|nr:MAG: hypothetical protein EA397_18050 [Deltaproteobacteria bacterium]